MCEKCWAAVLGTLSQAELELTRSRMAGLIATAIAEDGISQAEFARRVGSSTKHVNVVLRGRQFASMETLDHWASVLGRRWSVDLVAQGCGAQPTTTTWVDIDRLEALAGVAGPKGLSLSPDTILSLIARVRRVEELERAGDALVHTLGDNDLDYTEEHPYG